MGIQSLLEHLLRDIGICTRELTFQTFQVILLFFFSFYVLSVINLSYYQSLHSDSIRFDGSFSIFMCSSYTIEKWVNVEIIVGIPFLIKAIILGIQNILEVLLEGLGIPIMESIFLYTNITIIPHSVLYVSLSYYIINPCISASSNFDDSFS